MQDNSQVQQQTAQRQATAQRPPQTKQASKATTLSGSKEGVVCPNCGTINDPQATFCESCGTPLQETRCPNCGFEVDPETDFCEHCQTYIKSDRCSFCGAPMSLTDEFCQECGSPRRGIVCPTCHSICRFGFCAHCGTPLTDRARLELEAAWQVECAEQVRTLEREMEELWRTKPVNSKQDKVRRERNEELRKRVLKLLNDNGDSAYADTPIEKEHQQWHTTDELRTQIEEKRRLLQSLLDSMETKQTMNPAVARNTAMACKPHISRLAWRCNYRNALHPSPLACACPQKGGRWVVLSGNEEQQLTKDK